MTEKLKEKCGYTVQNAKNSQKFRYFSTGPNDFEFTVYSDAEKAQILKKLQKKGICFSGGYGWSPCEVFDYLRDKKLLSRSFKEIVWQGPNEWVVHDRI